MSAMAEVAAAIQVNSLTDLPTNRVGGIAKYGYMQWAKSKTAEDQEYYYRMFSLASEELSRRAGNVLAELGL